MRRLSAQDDFDVPGILLERIGEGAGKGGRLDRAKLDQTVFGLRDDLLSYDQDVAADEGDAAGGSGLAQ